MGPCPCWPARARSTAGTPECGCPEHRSSARLRYKADSRAAKAFSICTSIESKGWGAVHHLRQDLFKVLLACFAELLFASIIVALHALRCRSGPSCFGHCYVH